MSTTLSRVRNLDSSYTVNGADHVKKYYKPAGCTHAAGWHTYFLDPNLSFYCGRREWMRDVVVPGFNKRRARGEVFFNPMTKYTCEISPGHGKSLGRLRTRTPTCSAPYTYYPEFSYAYEGDVTYGRVLSGLDFPPVHVDWPVYDPPLLLTEGDCLSIRQEAATSCLSNRGRVSDSNLWETIAEFEQAMSLTTDLMTTMRKIILSNKGRIMASGIASAWLMWRYGVNPLISDIRNVVDALEKVGGQRRITSRGTARITKTGYRSGNGAKYGAISYSYTVQMIETYSSRAMSLDDVFVSFAEEIGLGLKGLLTLPWELTTLSFVLDWFLNFGDLFGAVVPAANATQLGCCTVNERVTRESFSVNSWVPANPGTYTLSESPDDALGERIQTLKQRSPTLENPALVIRSDFGLTKWRRACDSIALLSQAILSLKH